MLGHILLALNLRSDKEPLAKLGVFSNKVMVLWALAAVGTLVIATNVPGIAGALKLTSLTAVDWAVVVVAAAAATFWMEAMKILRRGT
jgi:Ca2+-transporting ATPase